MQYSSNRNLGRDAQKLTKVRAALRTTAHRIAPAVQAATSVSDRGGWYTGQRTPPGGTKASVHVETGHVANDGRPAARVVVEGAAVPENFRQNRDWILRAAGGQG